MWLMILALAKSLAAAVGGVKGEIANEVIGTVEAVQGAAEEVQNTVKPWIQWSNGIVMANRPATEDERNAARAFRDAVHQQNQLLATGTPLADLPPLPSPPTT